MNELCQRWESLTLSLMAWQIPRPRLLESSFKLCSEIQGFHCLCCVLRLPSHILVLCWPILHSLCIAFIAATSVPSGFLLRSAEQQVLFRKMQQVFPLFVQHPLQRGARPPSLKEVGMVVRLCFSLHCFASESRSEALNGLLSRDAAVSEK